MSKIRGDAPSLRLLTDDERAILPHMRMDWAHWLSTLAEYAGLPIGRARIAARSLRGRGLAAIEATFDDYTMLISGSGYMLTDAGIAAQSVLASEAQDDRKDGSSRENNDPSNPLRTAAEQAEGAAV